MSRHGRAGDTGPSPPEESEPPGPPGSSGLPARGSDSSSDTGPDRLYVFEDSPDGPATRPSDRPAVPRTIGRLDLVTLIVARTGPVAGMSPEHTAIMRMCRFPLSVAEVSAYLVLPVSTVTALLEDLLTGDQVESREPATVVAAAGALPDADILEAVMHGLLNL